VADHRHSGQSTCLHRGLQALNSKKREKPEIAAPSTNWRKSTTISGFFLDNCAVRRLLSAPYGTAAANAAMHVLVDRRKQGIRRRGSFIVLKPFFMAAIMLCPTAAFAQWALYDGTNINLVASNPVPVGLALEAFTLTADGLNGAVPNTFDSSNSGQGGTGITTVGTNLAQVWEFNGLVPTPTQNLVIPGDIPQNIDTHFLVNSNSIFSVVAPQENLLVANPTENPAAGFGNALWGTFAVPSQAATNWDFAYVVVPLNTTVNFDFQLAAPGFPVESVNVAWTLSFPTGDVNMDGIVNGQDIALVASNWLQTTRRGDANGDGIVNGQDIAEIASNWLATANGTVVPPPGGTAVPEPSGAGLAMVAAAAAAALWRPARRVGWILSRGQRDGRMAAG
jgi:hypothetical protein